MTTYKQVTEFFEDVVLDEGRTDVQSHVGIRRLNNETIEGLAREFFGGGVMLRPFSDIEECDRLVYVYEDDFYGEKAYKHFPWLKDRDNKHFIVLDACEQKVLCWAFKD